MKRFIAKSSDPSAQKPVRRSSCRRAIKTQFKKQCAVLATQRPVDARAIFTMAATLKSAGLLDQPLFLQDTALSLAARAQKPALIRDLLALGAHPNALAEMDQSPLMQAITGMMSGGDRALALECMKILVAAGADVHHRNAKKQQAIHWASWDRESREIAQWLISIGADPSSPADDDRTPLHYAALSGDAAMASALLDAGARLDALAWDSVQRQMVTPRDMARFWSSIHNGGDAAALLEREEFRQQEIEQLQAEALAPKTAKRVARLGL